MPRDQATISYTMSRIRSKDTKIEIRLRKALWASGLRYRKHYRKIPGCPDIVFASERLAVFCDSTFWHGRDWVERQKRIKSNREYWIPKIERNIERDKRVNAELKELGWKVIRFWDDEIEKQTDRCVAQICQALDARRNRQL